jgi:hypothetical protein
VVDWRSSSISLLFRCSFNCFSFLKRLRWDKPFRSALKLIVDWDCYLGLSHSLAQFFGNTQEDAFDALGCEPYSREIRDVSGGKAGAEVKPKDLGIALMVRPWNT